MDAAVKTAAAATEERLAEVSGALRRDVDEVTVRVGNLERKRSALVCYP